MERQQILSKMRDCDYSGFLSLIEASDTTYVLTIAYTGSITLAFGEFIGHKRPVICVEEFSAFRECLPAKIIDRAMRSFDFRELFKTIGNIPTYMAFCKHIRVDKIICLDMSPILSHYLSSPDPKMFELIKKLQEAQKK